MHKDFDKDLLMCTSVIQQGGVILYPTDTVWGIGCNPLDESAINKVSEIKMRPGDKSYIILVESLERLISLVGPLSSSVLQYLQNQSRPTTIIYDYIGGLAPQIVGSQNTIAVRLCSEPFCKELINALNHPLLSTSANISGMPTASVFDEISDKIKQGVDYVVHYRREDKHISKPSTILKYEKDQFVIIRE